MIELIMAWTGYWVGIGIELFVILIAGILLVLMLTGVMFRWIDAAKVRSAANKLRRAEEKAAREERLRIAAEEKARREAIERAEAEARAQAEAEARAQAEDEAERRRLSDVAATQAEEEPEAEEEAAEEETTEEAAADETAAAEAEEAAEEAEVVEEEPEAVEEAEEPEEELSAEDAELLEEDDEEEERGKKKKKKSKKHGKDEDEDELGESELLVVNDGIVFNDSKTITELYDELSEEQKGYFDELREGALQKPNAELSIARNFVTVKIGKRNLIKLLIKRGVTVAEFMLESEALKQLRLSNKNKRGKSSIKVKATTVQVIDLMSLKVAIDMIDLAYEELMLDD